MATFYVQTTGATTNSGSTDTNSATLSGAAATVAGSVVTLDGSPDLSGIVTSGATQSTIYLAGATNSNQKIFRITAVDDGADTVTVSGTPSGIGGTTSWAIGGRFVWTPASIEAALVAGDTVIINDDIATSASSIVTARVSGSNAAGFITVRGKTGTRPVLQTSGSGNPVFANASAFTGWRITNLEIRQTHASSGNGLNITTGWLVDNVKVTDAGTHGVSCAASGWRVINCEIGGSGGGAIVGDGVNSAATGSVIGCYIHDCGGDGIQFSAADTSCIAINNVIDSCTARGIYISGAHTGQVGSNLIIGNTIYGCGDSGLEVVDADVCATILNNIFQDNGNAAGESNIEWVAGTAEYFGYHSHNILYDNTGADASTAFITLGATEFTTDPLMTDPANADFTLSTSSPAKAAGFPGTFLGGPTTYTDIGAVQRQEPSSTGGGRIIGS
jgi:hypothetical protein